MNGGVITPLQAFDALDLAMARALGTMDVLAALPGGANEADLDAAAAVMEEVWTVASGAWSVLAEDGDTLAALREVLCFREGRS